METNSTNSIIANALDILISYERKRQNQEKFSFSFTKVEWLALDTLLSEAVTNTNAILETRKNLWPLHHLIRR